MGRSNKKYKTIKELMNEITNKTVKEHNQQLREYSDKLFSLSVDLNNLAGPEFEDLEKF